MKGTRANHAARRPRIPAFEVWVCTRDGLSRRISVQRETSARRSERGDILRTREGRAMTRTPAARAARMRRSTEAFSADVMRDSSERPCTSRRSNRPASPRQVRSVFSAEPPRSSRVMMWMTLCLFRPGMDSPVPSRRRAPSFPRGRRPAGMNPVKDPSSVSATSSGHHRLVLQKADAPQQVVHARPGGVPHAVSRDPAAIFQAASIHKWEI